MNYRLGCVGLALGTLLVTLCVGCTAPASEDPTENLGELYDEIIGGNGVSLNGVHLNGVHLNGVHLNGVHLNGVHLNGVHLNGVHLNGSALATTSDSGQLLTGGALIGSTFTGPLFDGSTGNFRIDAHDVVDGDTHLYTISWKPEGGDWSYACGTSAGVPVRAIPLQGYWNYEEGVPGGGSKTDDPGMITLACEHYALAKCVEFGYKPWAKTWKKQPLADHHQACTRMIRADYCGDGTPWTVDGTQINVYDHVGIQGDGASWKFESEWDEDGAICLAHQRIQQAGFVPACAFEKAANKCGKPVKWFQGTLLATEAP